MLIRLGGLFTLLAIALWLWAIFDSITAPPERIRLLPKAVWVIVVLLFADLGAIAWMVLGRPRAQGATGAGITQRLAGRAGRAGPTVPSPRPVRSTAPDDDPEFLRRLNDQMRRQRPDRSDGGDEATR
jgi:Phospholipase_D-nuclease N-terminal